MNKKLFLTFVLLIIFGLSLSAEFAELRNSYVVPGSMGNAYTAFINDGYSVYFNPAILPFLSDYQISTSYGKLYQMSDLAYTNFLISKGNNKYGMAFALDHFGFSLYREQQYFLSYGYRVTDKLSLGTNIKMLSLNIKTLGSKEVISYDLGGYYQLRDWLSLGVMGRNVNQPTLSTKVESSWQFGVSFTPHENLALNFDYYLPPYGYKNRFYTGFQLKVSEVAFFRMGYQTKPNNISAGFGLNFGGENKVFTLNYTYVHNQIFDYSNIVGITYQFDTFKHDLSKVASGRFLEYEEEVDISILPAQPVSALDDISEDDIEDMSEEEIEALADEALEQQEIGGQGFLSLADLEKLLKVHGDVSDEDLETVVGISDFSLPEPISTEDEIWTLFYAEEISEEDANLLQELIERPVNINEANIEDLMRLPNMTRIDAQNILDARKEIKVFETVDDLVVLDIIDVSIYDFISPFITTREVSSNILEYTFYFDNTLKDNNSTRMTQNLKTYIGKYTVNVLSDRDKGESEIDNLLKYSIRADGIIKDGDRLVIGNYGANFGYNMIFQKLRASQRNTIDIDDSRREYGNLKGIAYTNRRLYQKDWDLTLLYSENYYQAREIDNYGGDYKVYLSNSGKDKDITEKLFGINTRFKYSDNMRIGITGYTVDYSSDTDLGENLYYNQSYVYGFDFTYVTPHGYNAYGEKSFQKGGNNSILLGFGKRGQNLVVDMNYINNDVDYINFQSNNRNTRPDAAVVTGNVRYNINKQQRINLKIREGREKSTDIAYSQREILWQNRYDGNNFSPVGKIENIKNVTVLFKYQTTDLDINNFSDTAGRFYIERSLRYNYFASSAVKNTYNNNKEVQLRFNTNYPDNINLKYVRSSRKRYTTSGLFEARDRDNFEIKSTYRNRGLGFSLTGFFKRYYEFLEEEVEEEDYFFDIDEAATEIIKRDGYYNEYRLNYTQDFGAGYRLRVNTLARRYSEWNSRDYSQIQVRFDFTNITVSTYYRYVHDYERDTFRIFGIIDW